MSEANRGAIANVGFIVGRKAVAVVDTGGSVAEGGLLASIRQATALPVAYVINTHMHPDHAMPHSSRRGGALRRPPQACRRAGGTARQYLAANASLIGARLIADIKVVPPDLAVEKTLELDLGGRVLEVTAWPVAHTDNDVTVLDRETGTLFAGDLVFIGHLPVIDGRLTGWLAAMDEMAKLPAALVVPGHGPPAVPLAAALADQRRYLEAGGRPARHHQARRRSREAARTAGRSEQGRWSLFDEYNAGTPPPVCRARMGIAWRTPRPHGGHDGAGWPSYIRPMRKPCP